MRIRVDPDHVRIEGTEQELHDLASSLLEAAVLGEIIEGYILADHGVVDIRIRRLDVDADDDVPPTT